jgi:hypothetical protein
LSTMIIILVSIGAFNFYLKHQTSLIALTVKVEMCKLEFGENMCGMEGGPLPALVAQCRGWEECMTKDPHEYLHTDSEMMKSFNASMDLFYDEMMQQFLGVMLFALFCYTLVACCCKKVSRTISDRNPKSIEDHY